MSEFHIIDFRRCNVAAERAHTKFNLLFGTRSQITIECM